MRRLLFGVAALAFAGCGSANDSGQQPSDGPGTDLIITLVADEGAAPTVMTLTCDPVGGDHPTPDAACATLDGIDADVFEPVPANQACTMIYGGPQTVTVVGVRDGEQIDAALSRQNGCEISRWDALGTDVLTAP